MTVHEKFTMLTGYEEPIHIKALKTLLAELQENNPDTDYGWCVSKYKGLVDWLQSDSGNQELQEGENGCEYCETLVEYISTFGEYRGKFNYCPVCGRKINQDYQQMELEFIK